MNFYQSNSSTKPASSWLPQLQRYQEHHPDEPPCIESSAGDLIMSPCQMESIGSSMISIALSYTAAVMKPFCGRNKQEKKCLRSLRE